MTISRAEGDGKENLAIFDRMTVDAVVVHQAYRLRAVVARSRSARPERLRCYPETKNASLNRTAVLIVNLVFKAAEPPRTRTENRLI